MEEEDPTWMKWSLAWIVSPAILMDTRLLSIQILPLSKPASHVPDSFSTSQPILLRGGPEGESRG
uniref:Uncharacterized protein n=1 Tax=Physcomitrium patens TaxID=3218 RepID=A0A2K1KHH9_PHYPA|nr:hypothetical protein PHYPA_009612 [Physcomitrium patens]